MATTVTSVSNYAGKPSAQIMGAAFKEASTLKSGFITLNQNINYKLNLRKGELTGGRRNYSCDFLPAGSVALGEKVVEPKKLRDDLELCKEEFRNQWDDGSLGDSAWNTGNMEPVMDFILAKKLEKEAAEVEDMIWTGDNNAAGEFGGFLPQFEADSDVIKVDGVEITETNVVTEIKRALIALPARLRKKPVKVGLSSDIWQAFSFLLIDKSIQNGLGGDANTELKLGKATLVELTGLPDNTMVISQPENLVFATGNEDDLSYIKTTYMGETMNEEKIRLTMVYTGGTGYFYGDEIVYYRPEDTPSV